jgi:nicotinamide riboside kinase
LIFCDTNLYVIKIWSEHKFGQCDPWILEEIAKRKYNLHLLTSIDIPWEEDPQREHPQMRKYFFDVYHNEMIHIKTKFSVIKGLNDSRLKAAIQAVKRIL